MSVAANLPIHAADVYGEECQRHPEKEHLKLLASQDNQVRTRRSVSSRRKDAPEEVSSKGSEYCKSNDLEDDTGHHHGVPNIQAIRIAAARRGRLDASATGLEKKRDYVCSYEDPSIELWPDK